MEKKTEALIASLVDGLEPVRPLRRQTGMLVALAAMAAGALVLLALVGLGPVLLSARPDGIGLVAAGLFLALATACAWTTIDAARPSVGARRDGWVWSLVTAAILPLGALATILVSLANGHGPAVEDDGRECVTYGLLAGLLTAGVLVVWLRRGAPARIERAGLLTGLASGSAGSFAVSLYCPHTDIVHIGVWHVLTVAVAGVLGRCIVPPLVRW